LDFRDDHLSAEALEPPRLPAASSVVLVGPIA